MHFEITGNKKRRKVHCLHYQNYCALHEDMTKYNYSASLYVKLPVKYKVLSQEYINPRKHNKQNYAQ